MSQEKGKIVTFYSYKGGVGRTISMASISWLFYKIYNKKILVIDWDLEAPGVYRYFGYKESDVQNGLIDMLLDIKQKLYRGSEYGINELVELEKYISRVKVSNYGCLDFMSSGKLDDMYPEKVSFFDWQAFYDEWNGYGVIEIIKEKIKDKYDYIFIDSRTGFTDISGVCLRQMPDILMFCFVYNEQNLYGLKYVLDIIDKDYGDKKKKFFMPTNIDVINEVKRRGMYEKKFFKLIKEYVGKVHAIKTSQYFNDMSIPNVPYFNYGEELPVRDKPDELNSKRYKQFAKYLIESLEDNDKDIISQIEKEYDIKLNQFDKLKWNKNGFVLEKDYEGEKVSALNLSKCSINNVQRLVDILKRLTGLQELWLNGNKLSELGPIGMLTGLQKLSLGSNDISELGPLSTLTGLQELWLNDNRINELDPLSELTGLQHLSLNSNEINELSPLTVLTGLKELWLNGNRINELGPLSVLTGLKELWLNGNRISELGPLSGLTGLQWLSLENNKLSELGPLSELTGLQHLSLNSNELSELGPLSGLTGLQWLSLDNNQIGELGPLSELAGLQRLSLNSNEISELRPLSGLAGLKELWLDSNRISQLGSLSGLAGLATLSLKKNLIKALPKWMTDFSMEIRWSEYGYKGIILYDNPLELPPPEIVKQGKKAVKNYFKQLEEQDRDYLFEAKLLILGEPGAGKTSLAWKLKDHDCDLPGDDETTRGIDVRKISFPIHKEDFPELDDAVSIQNRSFRINVWDFGGQEIYMATHRFFLNKRSLYVLVADNRMDDTDFNYWLHLVEMFGGDSPLLIVQNEKQARKRDIDISAMRARFGNIQNDVLRVNFADENHSRLEELKREIRRQIIKLPHIGNPVPAKWTVIRDVLEQDHRHTLSYEEYLELCAKYGIKEKKDALVLARYFHDIGVFLHFQDDPLLRKTIFLDSDWATNAVYKILNDPLLDEKQGRFSIADVELIWCEAEYDLLRSELLRLMNKFYLVYEVYGSGDYIVPDKLPSKKPVYGWKTRGNLFLIFDYDLFMPKGVISQFILEMHRFIADHQKVWKRGCVIEREGAIAEVVESYDTRSLHIRISGSNKRDFMTIIVDQLDRINAQYEKMKVEKLIPCSCNECKESGEPYGYKFSDLKRRIEKGRHEVECGKSYEMVSVQKLIDDVLYEQMPEKERQKVVERKKSKIFISYSHKDKLTLERLKTHLKVLSYEGVDVDQWDDTTVKSEEKWEEKIKEALDIAGVAVMLVSTDFLASDLIVKNELTPLLQAAEKEGTTILPLIVGSCRFGKSKLSVFQSVNDPNNPLSKLPKADQDDVFIKLVDRIEELIS